jgi:phage terminase small subunit
MPAGRPPKPTAIKELHGNPGRRPLNDKEPKMEPGEPERPRFLRNKGARRWFRQYAERLVNARVVTKNDSASLGLLAHFLGWYEEAAEDLNVRGPVLTGTRTLQDGSTVDYEYPSPYWKLLMDSANMIDKFGSKLGYSPIDRQHLKIEAGEPPVDAMQMLVDGAKKVEPILIPDLSDITDDEPTAKAPEDETSEESNSTASES